MQIQHLDHLVLTVHDIEQTCTFYSTVLGMRVITFGDDRKALQFGQQKLNLHQVGQELQPNALRATPGSADLCFITETPLPQVIDHLHACRVAIESGIVRRTGAIGLLQSIYIRDPDGNLLELSNLELSNSGDANDVEVGSTES